MHYCKNCNTALPATAMQCPRCGTPVSQNVGMYGSADYSAETVAGGYAPLPDRASAPNSPSSPYGSTPMPYGSTPGNSTGSQNPFAYNSSPQQYYADSAQQYYSNTTPRYAPPPPQATPAALGNNRRKGPSNTMVITLVIVAALVMIGGVGLIFNATVLRPAQLRSQATATAVTASTQATATVKAQTTATAVAQTQATATSVAQAQATSTAIQNIYNKATGGTPALSSSLAAQTASNWDVYNAQGGGGCAFTGGALHANIPQKNFYVPCFAHATNFSNFAFEVQMTIMKGDEGGVIFRANDATSKYYYFRVGHDGVYSLYLSKDDKHSTALIYDNSTAIKTENGQTNLLTVIAQGDNIYLFINKQFVGSVNDASYRSGTIGVFAGDNTNPTDVAFNNVRVWTI